MEPTHGIVVCDGGDSIAAAAKVGVYIATLKYCQHNSDNTVKICNQYIIPSDLILCSLKWSRRVEN
jgi:nitrite reductase/ring-hydroxylating ferredoxin subunit